MSERGESTRLLSSHVPGLAGLGGSFLGGIPARPPHGRKEVMTRYVVVLAAAALFFGGASGTALAGTTFGTSVSSCAQMSLGARDNPPAITCSHNGTTMTFATFGGMVRHMQAGC